MRSVWQELTQRGEAGAVGELHIDVILLLKSTPLKSI